MTSPRTLKHESSWEAHSHWLSYPTSELGAFQLTPVLKSIFKISLINTNPSAYWLILKFFSAVKSRIWLYLSGYFMEGTSQAADGCFGLSCTYYTAIKTKELLERIFPKMDNPLLQHNLVKYVKLRTTFLSEQPCDGKVHYLISHNITTLLYLQHVLSCGILAYVLLTATKFLLQTT